MEKIGEFFGIFDRNANILLSLDTRYYDNIPLYAAHTLEHKTADQPSRGLILVLSPTRTSLYEILCSCFIHFFQEQD